MGLRAACYEKEGGVPADEPPHRSVGGERAPLPRMRPSPRPQPLWGGGGVMSPPCPRGRAIALGTPSVGTCRVSLGGESPFVASFPSPRCWGLLGGLARGVRAGPQGESSPWVA